MSEKRKTYGELNAEVTQLKQQLEQKQAEIKDLKFQLAWLRKKVFGRMSEKNLPLDPNSLQLNLFAEPQTPDPEVMAENDKDLEKENKLVTVKEHNRAVRSAVDTSSLETVTEDIYPELKNPDAYVEIGTETTRQLEIIPGKMFVKEIIRHKFALRSEIQNTHPEIKAIEIAPLPQMPIHKCMASASVLADIVVEKFLYHLPFYRTIQKYKEYGVVISDSTMNDWYAATCERLKPLYDRMREIIMESDYLQLDESTLPVIDNEKHRAVKGYIWAVRNANTGTVYFYYDHGSRSHEVARKILCTYHGTIQVDGYDAYDQFEKTPGICVIGCFAHARRRFVDALDENKEVASEAIAYIAALYEIESRIKEFSFEEKKAIRQKESYGILKEFEIWLSQRVTSSNMRKSRLADAINYTYAYMPRLARYVNDGRYSIDNNDIERNMKAIACGRKNYLFCGNDASAVRASIVYTLVRSCVAISVDPRQYLEDVLVRMPGPSAKHHDIDHLLPQNWKPSSSRRYDVTITRKSEQ